MNTKQKIQLLCTTAPKKCTMPILSHIKLESTGRGTIRCTASDLENWVICELPAVETSAPISMTVPAAQFKSAFKEQLQISQYVDPETKVHSLKIGAITLIGESSSEYPSIPSETIFNTIAINPAAFADLLYAASTDATRYNLCGVCWDHKTGQLVATDGHRLALRNVGVKAEQPKEAQGRSFILPTKGCTLLKNFSTMELNNSWTMIKATSDDGSILYSRLIDGEFPDYSQVVPKKAFGATIAGLPIAPMVDALQELLQIAGKGEIMARFDIAQGKGKLTYSSPTTGSYEHQFNSFTLKDRQLPFVFGINARYLLDALDAACKQGSTVDIQLMPPNEKGQWINPIQINLDIIMPMRLAD